MGHQEGCACNLHVAIRDLKVALAIMYEPPKEQEDDEPE